MVHECEATRESAVCGIVGNSESESGALRRKAEAGSAPHTSRIRRGWHASSLELVMCALGPRPPPPPNEARRAARRPEQAACRGSALGVGRQAQTWDSGQTLGTLGNTQPCSPDLVRLGHCRRCEAQRARPAAKLISDGTPGFHWHRGYWLRAWPGLPSASPTDMQPRVRCMAS